ncbi:hypothetical protein M2271_000539 [Streptomyces sp. LBL]|uniref:hypothetical protein n=1 Tax=Streptomyces sp. LBL TaxID=2940562 RepID=UPI0024737852|nr:hypothetical protein [Streptomyces sp. LBL]MDH6622752.1 hypothetical protein [Streptomyces sp. LBL]
MPHVFVVRAGDVRTTGDDAGRGRPGFGGGVGSTGMAPGAAPTAVAAIACLGNALGFTTVSVARDCRRGRPQPVPWPTSHRGTELASAHVVAGGTGVRARGGWPAP